MSFFGLPRGRNKALNTVRIVLLNGGVTNNATIYYDSGFGNGQSGGAGTVVTYQVGTNLPIFATGGAGTATSTAAVVNNIEIFDSFGFTSRVLTGAGTPLDFFMDLPGGNGYNSTFMAAGTLLWVTPLVNPVFDPNAASQPEMTINFYD